MVLLREGATELFLAKGNVGRAGASSVVEMLMRGGVTVLLLDKPDAGGRASAISAVDGNAGEVGLRLAVVVLARSMVGRLMGSVRSAGTVALLLNPSSSFS